MTKINKAAYQSSFFEAIPEMESNAQKIFHTIDKAKHEDFDMKLKNQSSQKDLTKKINEQIHNKLKATLPSNQHKALFISNATYGTANWLSSACNFKRFLKLNHDDFTEGLRLRLLIPIFSYNILPNTKCICSKPIDKDPFHGLTCKNHQGIKIQTHNEIRDGLANLIKTISPYAQVKIEQTLGKMANEERANPTTPKTDKSTEIRCDIWVADGSDLKLLDVKVTCPASQTNIAKNSHTTPHVANILSHKLKMDHYKNYLIEKFHHTITPFVLETSGRLSKESEKYLDKIFGLAKAIPSFNKDLQLIRKEFILHINNILVRSNAKLVRYSRAHGADVSNY